MKSCPTCNRTYPDDVLAFCLVDGSILSAPYDPEATQRIPSARSTNPPPTEVLHSTLKSGGQAYHSPLSSTHMPKDLTPSKGKRGAWRIPIAIPVVLLVLWLLGFILGIGGGLIHILFTVGAVIFITIFIIGRAKS
jgi:hypothetical protein